MDSNPARIYGSTMKTYTSIREAVSDLKARTGHGYVSYFVNGTQVGAADYGIGSSTTSRHSKN